MKGKKKCPQCGNMRKIFESRTLCNSCRRFNTEVSLGRLRTPEYEKVTVEGYKLPMQKVEEGFGYLGAVTTTTDGKHVQCHICGYYFAALGSHVSTKHAMKPKEYKTKFGLRKYDGLLSPVARKDAQFRYNKYSRKTPEEFREMTKKAQKALKKKRDRGDSFGGNTWSAQTRNEKGMCKEQTAAKIHHIAEMYDAKPTMRAFCAEFGEGQRSVVEHWWGSWDNALKELGYNTHRERLVQYRKEERQRIIDNIKEFYEREGRTPQNADFNTLSYFPSRTTVSRIFGSMNAARREAEVPELMFYKGEWIEVQEVKEEPRRVQIQVRFA